MQQVYLGRRTEVITLTYWELGKLFILYLCIVYLFLQLFNCSEDYIGEDDE